MDFHRDIRYALRSLGKSKGFAAVAVTSLALALGLNTTTYAVLDAFMHPYVPYRQPDRLVRISAFGDPRGERVTWADRAVLLHDRLAPFAESLTFFMLGFGTIPTQKAGDPAYFADVAPNFFSVLDVPVELGRTFHESGDENAVVVSHSYWTRELARRKSLEGASVTIDERSYAIIGVLPSTMAFPHTDFWRAQPAGVFAQGFGWPLLRLKREVRLEELEASLNELSGQLTARYGVARQPFRYAVNTLRPDPYDLSNFHLAMAASALAVLLIACANLANLMLARGVARRGELSLRLAIGASRGALVRQLLAEALLLAAAGGALGVFAAAWGVSIAGSEWPRLPFLALRAPHLSWRIFAFGVLATGATVVLFGLFPALRASRVNVAEPLKESGSTTTGRVRHYSWLAITQVALALMLLMSATVLAKSAYRIATTIFGYEPRGLLQAIVNLRQQQFANGEAVQARFDHLLETVRGVEGVRVAATSAGARTDGGVAISDYEGDSLSLISLFGYRQVSPDYFRALGTTVLAGRDFTAGDREAGGAAIVNEAAAQALWPNQSPVGRLIKLGHPRSPVPWVRVVGMAQNARYGTFDIIEPHLPPRPEVYLVPALDSARGRSIVFRAEGDSARVALNVARAIQAAASLRSPPFVFPMLINLAYYTNSLRFATRLFTFLGLCGMGLAAVGLYGVLAYAVSRRTREFGVRFALGARAEDLFRMVFHDGAVMFLAGTAIGAFVAMGASTLVESLLFGVPPTDAASLVISELVLLGAALLACLGPALRAMRADPVEILRAT